MFRQYKFYFFHHFQCLLFLTSIDYLFTRDASMNVWLRVSKLKHTAHTTNHIYLRLNHYIFSIYLFECTLKFPPRRQTHFAGIQIMLISDNNCKAATVHSRN